MTDTGTVRKKSGVLAGVAAIAVAVAIAVPTLLDEHSAPAASSITTARLLTVTIAPAVIPLSDAELLALMDHSPQLGALEVPARLASCLDGLGYPATAGTVLGATEVQINHRPAVVLLLPADEPGRINVLAVGPQCSSAHTGLLADTVLARP